MAGLFKHFNHQMKEHLFSNFIQSYLIELIVKIFSYQFSTIYKLDSLILRLLFFP
jgi:hypothetical protein